MDLKQKLENILNVKQTSLTPENIKKGVKIFGVSGNYSSLNQGVYLYNSYNEMINDGHSLGDYAFVYSSNTLNGFYQATGYNPMRRDYIAVNSLGNPTNINTLNFGNYITAEEVNNIRTFLQKPEIVTNIGTIRQIMLVDESPDYYTGYLENSYCSNIFSASKGVLFNNNVAKYYIGDSLNSICKLKFNIKNNYYNITKESLEYDVSSASYVTVNNITSDMMLDLICMKGVIDNGIMGPETYVQIRSIKNDTIEHIGYPKNSFLTSVGYYTDNINVGLVSDNSPVGFWGAAYYGNNGVVSSILNRTNEVSFDNIDSFRKSYIGTLNNLRWVTNSLYPNTTITANAFINNTSLRYITNLYLYNTQDTSNMFNNCINLIGVSLGFNSTATNTTQMFYNCTNLKQCYFDGFYSTTNTARMFYNCTNLQTLQTPNLNFKNCTNAIYMFYGSKIGFISDVNMPLCNAFNCMFESTNLKTIPNIVFHNDATYAYMFTNCLDLVTITSLNFSGLSNINITGMFSHCTSLTSVPNINFGNINSITTLFGNAATVATRSYEGCRNLTNIPNFNLQNILYTVGTFRGCYNLRNIPNFDLSNVISTVRMFVECTNLTNIPNFNLTNLTNATNMFRNCCNLQNVPTFNLHSIENTSNMFCDCFNLSDVPILNLNTATNTSWMFRWCNNLTNASVLNIVDSLINSNDISKNLSNTNRYSPLYLTKFDNTYYQSRLEDLTNAGWTY